MTTTQHTIGLGGSERISSRVLKPPGGGSSNIFGPADEVVAPARVNTRGASTLVLGDEPAAAPSAPPAEPAPAEEQEQEQNGEETPAAPATEEGAGEPDPAAAPAPPPAAEPQKPRRQPPGGYSTPLW